MSVDLDHAEAREDRRQSGQIDVGRPIAGVAGREMVRQRTELALGDRRRDQDRSLAMATRHQRRHDVAITTPMLRADESPMNVTVR